MIDGVTLLNSEEWWGSLKIKTPYITGNDHTLDIDIQIGLLCKTFTIPIFFFIFTY